MKSVIFLAAAAVVSARPQAPRTPAPGSGEEPRGCLKLSEIKPLADPLTQFVPKNTNFPCNMGDPIPFGPVPKGCGKFEVIVARGTSEPGAFGSMVGDPLVARVIRDMPGVNVRGYAVQYPADAGGNIRNGTLTPAQVAHQAIGPNDIVNRIAQQSKECPDEKFALVGYSQGGAVVYRAAPLIVAQPELAKKVLAVVFYGAMNGSLLALPKSTLLANCAPGDQACSDVNALTGTPQNVYGHVSYNDVGSKWHDRSSQFIVSAFNGKQLGPKLMKTPTESLV